MSQIEKHSLHTVGKSRGIFVAPVFLNAKKNKSLTVISTGYFKEQPPGCVRLGSFLLTVANRFHKKGKNLRRTSFM